VLIVRLLRTTTIPVAATPAAVSAPEPAAVEASPVVIDEARIDAAVASLSEFADAREQFRHSRESQRQFRERIAGRHVRWEGRIRHTLWPGTYRLVVDLDHAEDSVKLVPVSPEARRDARRIAAGARVEAEGVLMDDQSVHVTSVRETQ